MDCKVTNILSKVFNAKEDDVSLLSPKGQPINTMSRSGGGDYIIYYVSHKDGKEPKRSNVNGALTELERFYEQLNLDNEDIVDAAQCHD